MRPIRNRLVFLMQAVIWLSVTSVTFGQAAPPKPMTEAEFTELLKARQSQVDQMVDLDDAGKAKVKDLYSKALLEMDAGKRWATKTAQNEALATGCPKETVQTKSDLAGLPAQATTTIRPDATLLQIEQTISQRQADLEKLRKELADDEEELKGRAARQSKIPEQINEVKKSLADINAKLQAPAASDEKPAVIFARRMILLAQRRRVEQEIICHEKELGAYEARTELLPLHHDLKARQIALADQEIKQLQEFTNRRRQLEAEQQAQHASQEAGQAPSASVLRELAETNVGLAATRQPLAQAIADITRQQEQVKEKLAAVQKKYDEVTEQVKAAGNTNVSTEIGLFLRKKREELPGLREYVRNTEQQQHLQRDIELTLLKLTGDRLALSDMDKKTSEVLHNASRAELGNNPAELEAAVRAALKTQSEYLDALINDYNTYYKTLVALLTTETTLIKETGRCASTLTSGCSGSPAQRR